ncbi:MAG: hypothetical protein KIT27_09235 [Legionellales bacterium]|nr:hypothetical protein [Legionellales bacterium]
MNNINKKMDANIALFCEYLERYRQNGLRIAPVRQLLNQQLSSNELIIYADCLPNCMNDELTSLIEFPVTNLEVLNVYRRQRIADLEHFFYEQYQLLNQCEQALLAMNERIVDDALSKRNTFKEQSSQAHYQELRESLIQQQLDQLLDLIRLILLKNTNSSEEIRKINRVMGKDLAKTMTPSLRKVLIQLRNSLENRMDYKQTRTLSEQFDVMVLGQDLIQILLIDDQFSQVNSALMKIFQHQPSIKENSPEFSLKGESLLDELEDLMNQLTIISAKSSNLESSIHLQSVFFQQGKYPPELLVLIDHAENRIKHVLNEFPNQYKKAISLRDKLHAIIEHYSTASDINLSSFSQSNNRVDDENIINDAHREEKAILYTIAVVLAEHIVSEQHLKSDYQYFINSFKQDNYKKREQDYEQLTELKNTLQQSGEHSLFLKSIVHDVTQALLERHHLTLGLNYFVESISHSFSYGKIHSKVCRNLINEITHQAKENALILSTHNQWGINSLDYRELNFFYLLKSFSKSILAIPSVIPFLNPKEDIIMVDNLDSILRKIEVNLHSESGYIAAMTTDFNNKITPLKNFYERSKLFLEKLSEKRKNHTEMAKELLNVIEFRLLQLQKFINHLENRSRTLSNIYKCVNNNKEYLIHLQKCHQDQILKAEELSRLVIHHASHSLLTKRAEILLDRYTHLKKAETIIEQSFKMLTFPSRHLSDFIREALAIVKTTNAEIEWLKMRDAHLAYINQWSRLRGDDNYEENIASNQNSIQQSLEELKVAVDHFLSTRYDCLTRKLLLIRLLSYLKRQLLTTETTIDKDHLLDANKTLNNLTETLLQAYTEYRGKVELLITKRQAMLARKKPHFLFTIFRQFKRKINFSNQQCLLNVEEILNYLYLAHRQHVSDDIMLEELDQRFAMTVHSLIIAYQAAQARLQQIKLELNSPLNFKILRYISRQYQSRYNHFLNAKKNVNDLENRLLDFIDNFANNVAAWQADIEQQMEIQEDEAMQQYYRKRRLKIVGKS